MRCPKNLKLNPWPACGPLALLIAFVFFSFPGACASADADQNLDLSLNLPRKDGGATLKWKGEQLIIPLIFTNRGSEPISIWEHGNSEDPSGAISFEIVGLDGDTALLRRKPNLPAFNSTPKVVTLKPGDHRNDEIRVTYDGWENANHIAHRGAVSIRAIYHNAIAKPSHGERVKLWTGTINSEEEDCDIQEEE